MLPLLKGFTAKMLVAASIVPAAANGAVIVQNVSWDLSYELVLTQSTTTTLVISHEAPPQLKLFDPSLGTLTKVDYVLTSSPTPIWIDQFFARNVSVQSLQGSFGAFSKWFFPTTPGFGNLGASWGNSRPFSLDPLQDWTEVFSGSVTGNFALEHLPFFPIDVPNPALFTDSFFGTGTFDFRPSWEIGINASLDDGVEFLFRKSWAADYQLIYTYTPSVSPVPEPGTLVMLGIALAGLTFARRLR